MNILFVCKHNRFRSKVAEALFNHFNKNKDMHAKSAGVKLDQERPYVADSVKETLREIGVPKVEDTPQEINKNLINWADKIIIVANNVDPEGFPKKKTAVWSIGDTDQSNTEQIKAITHLIEWDVKSLIKRINQNGH